MSSRLTERKAHPFADQEHSFISPISCYKTDLQQDLTMQRVPDQPGLHSDTLFQISFTSRTVRAMLISQQTVFLQTTYVTENRSHTKASLYHLTLEARPIKNIKYN